MEDSTIYILVCGSCAAFTTRAIVGGRAITLANKRHKRALTTCILLLLGIVTGSNYTWCTLRETLHDCVYLYNELRCPTLRLYIKL